MHKLIIILISVFFYSIATINGFGTPSFLLLFVLGLTSLATWNGLEKEEKYFLLGLGLFFICMALSLINTEDVDEGIKRLGKYLIFVLSIPVYLLIRKHKIYLSDYLLLLISLSVVFMAVQSVYQLNVLGMERATGGYNPLILGSIAMAMAAILVSAILTLGYSIKQKAILMLVVLLALYVVAMAGGRGIMLFVPLYALWLFFHYRKSLSVKTFLSVVIALIIGSSFLLSTEVMQTRISRGIDQYNNFIANPDQNPDKTDSVGLRANLWKDSVTIWTHNPVLGTGLGDFYNDSKALYKSGYSNADHNLSHAHSIYFNTLATGGMLGLASMMLFVLFLPYRFFRKAHSETNDKYIKFYSLSGMSIVLAYAEFGLFESLFSRNAFILSFLMFLIVLMSNIFLRKNSNPSTSLET